MPLKTLSTCARDSVLDTPIRRRAAMALMSAGLVGGCQLAELADPAYAQEDPPNVPSLPSIKWVLDGEQSAIRKPMRAVIRTTEAMMSLWREAFPNATPPQEMTALPRDHVLVAVFLGDKPSTGYGVTIDLPEVSSNRDAALVLHVSTTTPRGLVKRVITFPYALALVGPLQGRAVAFND